jgi:hypothetical protein
MRTLEHVGSTTPLFRTCGQETFSNEYLLLFPRTSLFHHSALGGPPSHMNTEGISPAYSFAVLTMTIWLRCASAGWRAAQLGLNAFRVITA